MYFYFDIHLIIYLSPVPEESREQILKYSLLYLYLT